MNAVPPPPRVRFYGCRQTYEKILPKLLAQANKNGKHVVVRSTDQDRIRKINEILWSSDAESFLPHGMRDDGGDASEHPIYLTTGTEVPNAATLLVLLDGADSSDEVNFERIFYIYDEDEKDSLARALAFGRSLDADSKVEWVHQATSGKWGKLGPDAPETATSAAPTKKTTAKKTFAPKPQPEAVARKSDEEHTLSIIKPDATQANITGKINARLEESGLKIIAQKRLLLTRTQSEAFYAEHRERPFFASLCKFMTSGPVVVQVLEGPGAILRNRELMGATNPKEAAEGTIRRDFAFSVERNSVHGSDSPESAAREISFFFATCEIVG